MKKLYTISLLIFGFFFSQFASAQNLTNENALKLVNKNLDKISLLPEDVFNSKVTNAYTDNVSKLQLVYLQQTYQGIDVYNTLQVIAFKNGNTVSVTGGRIYGIEDRVTSQKILPAIAAKSAVNIAASAVLPSSVVIQASPLTTLREMPAEHKIQYQPNALSREPITAQMLWVPQADSKVHLAWQVSIAPENTPDHFMILVDANSGIVLGKDNLTTSCEWDKPKKEPVLWPENEFQLKETASSFIKGPTAVNSAQYKVIPFPAESVNHPGGALTVVTNPWLMAGAGNNATTLNWHNDGSAEYDYTRGNNVWAGDDPTGLNSPRTSAFSTTPLPDLTFNFPYNPSQAPDSPNNKKLAITNLFYWNNIMHDVSYQYGFDEVSGNFQNSNLSRGGAGNDYVIADAQDGGGRNNANFSTKPDGSSPRMQMYLWDGNIYTKIFLNAPYNTFLTSIEGDLSLNNRLKDKGTITAQIVLYNDDAGGTTHNACVPAANAAALVGKIALIDKSAGCSYTTQVKNAQNAGAVAVFIISDGGTITTMQGSDNSITIPAFMIFKSNGTTIKNYIASNTLTATLKSELDLDGDLDNGIVAHEYTHGISTRLTGGPSNVLCLQNKEQMGEGWSDYFALMMTTDWQTATTADGTKRRPLGTYIFKEDPTSGSGIRNYPYSTDMTINPLTYGDLQSIANSEPHDIGEVWAAVLWDMTWNIIQMDGINKNIYNADGAGGNSAALKLVTLGMKLQPCSPGFLDGRDAILKADELLFDGKYRCAIWSAFSRRGMGLNARQGSSDNSTDQTEDFSLPTGAIIRKTVDQAESPQNGKLNYTFTVKAQCQPVSNFKIVDTLPSNVTYVSGGTYNAANRTVTFNIPNLAPMEVATFTMSVKVATGTFFASSTVFSESFANTGVPPTFTATSNTSANWNTNSSTYNLAANSIRSGSSSVESEQILKVASPIMVTGHMQLRFFQRLVLDQGKDGGVVELSLNGLDWFDASPYIVKNGYNGTINAKSKLDGKAAYTGRTNTFDETIVNLSAFQNQSVYFRFRYVTDESVSSLGWYIDDITVTKEAAVYNIARIFDNSNTVRSLSDTITAITSVVPVTWSSFTAQKDGSTALLKWSTAQEFNSDHFVIERSTDGAHFTGIAKVDAAGTSSNTTNYSYADRSPAFGNIYYRIRQVDKDGQMQFSEIKLLSFNDFSAKSISLTPNPARVDVDLVAPGNKSVLNVQIFDATGRIVKSLEMRSEKITINVDQLSAGVYYVRIKGHDVDVMKKLVKEK